IRISDDGPWFAAATCKANFLKQAEQFEDDYDNNNHSDYVEDISVHAVTDIRLGLRWRAFMRADRRRWHWKTAGVASRRSLIQGTITKRPGPCEVYRPPPSWPPRSWLPPPCWPPPPCFSRSRSWLPPPCLSRSRSWLPPPCWPPSCPVAVGLIGSFGLRCASIVSFFILVIEFTDSCARECASIAEST